MPIQPLPCGSGGSGDAGADVEQTLLCDLGPDGEVLGTALAVYEYDSEGNPVGAPTFVDPVTGLPYVAQGILQPCPGDVGCGAPTQFCFQSTAPVDQPGRMYDVTFTLAQGFNVQSIVKDLVETPVNITWEVTDPDASAFVTALQTAIQSQFAGQTVTVTPGVVDPCTGLADFAVHIECLRIDQNPPTLLQLKYNAGRDAIVNPAFLSTPPMADNGGAQFLMRQDNPGSTPFGDSGDVNCTDTANRGWETNDRYGSFEVWGPPGNIYNTAAGTTPTPRGTGVQEINSFGSGPINGIYGDAPNTIWQTFTIPAGGNFRVKVVVGGRASTENIGIKLSTGDVNDTGIGDIINTSVNAGQVTNQDPVGNNDGAVPGPWTTYDNTVPLAAGTYTMAFTGPDKPDGGVGGNAFGGLFTDMRVYQDAPNTLANFTNDDETCVVPTTSNSTICEFWAPRCAGGDIVGWYNVADGEELTNAEFWAQVPAPTCCTSSGEEGASSTGNLVYTYLVCATLNGETRTMSRVVVSDQAGGIIADSFIDTDGAPVTPDTWQPGQCPGGTPTVGEFILCDDVGPFVRKLIQNAQGLVTQVVNVTLGGAPYAPVGTVQRCDCAPIELAGACYNDVNDINRPYRAYRNCDRSVSFYDGFSGEDITAYIEVNGVASCLNTDFFTERFCDANGVEFIRTYNVSSNGSFDTPPVIQDHNLDGTVFIPTLPIGQCPAEAADTEVIPLCDDADGTQFLRRLTFDSTGALTGTVDTLNDGTPYVLVGDAVDCAQVVNVQAIRDSEQILLCDANGTRFLRTFVRDGAGTITATLDTTLAGAAFVPVGAVAVCPATVTTDQVDTEVLVLCDATPTRFLRAYKYDAETGAVVAVVNTTLDGITAFAPVGAVGLCTTPVLTDLDFAEEILCSTTAGVTTPFIRRFTFNSQTGAVTATTNLTLAGGPFVPGTVDVCSNCCPVVAGNGCSNTGSGFYTAIRATNGTISLIDSVTGVAITGANVIPCPSDNTVRTLTAQARLVGDADAPWTPGADVVGTLTSVTMTVLSGTATLTDQNGTVSAGLPAGLTLTWGAEDDNQLSGPTSIDAIGGSTVVNWTQR
ncbi:hypothetical protein [Streptomyces sp. NBC_01207]|uniref:hypothetical protein n=1 Tax=Streptomyces sp. NBC_01207 TaxID=2903772 RepID=UPI002E115125|nr:hypothetical protein OG457_27480 [Streptomyces sp. NBC_01207]